MFAAVVTLAAVATLASCGIPTSDRPRPLTSALMPHPPTPTGPAIGTGPSNPVTTPPLYFTVGQDKVRPARRQSPTGTAEQRATALLDELITGPTTLEQSAGLANAIPPGLTLTLTDLSNGNAVVDLAGADPGPAATQAPLAVGQVVLTLTGLPEIVTVSLTRNGQPIEASLPDGSLTAQPLTRDDYVALIAS